MIGYICKYTPIEIFEAMGVETRQLTGIYNKSLSNAMCIHTKAILKNILSTNYEGIILTTCCKSHIELYSLLKTHFPDKYIYLLDIPKKLNNSTNSLFKNQLLSMVKSYENFSGKVFNENIFKSNLNVYKPKPYYKPINIGIIGDKCSQGLINTLDDTHINILFDFTCRVTKRDLKVYANNILLDYTYKLLSLFPCNYMEDAKNRKYYIDKYKYYLSGILYTAVKSCDNTSYDYNELKETLNIPILRLEIDYSKTCEKEIETKLQAFINAFKFSEVF